MLSTCRLQIARARTDEVVALQDQREGLFLQVLREDLAGFVKQVKWEHLRGSARESHNSAFVLMNGLGAAPIAQQRNSPCPWHTWSLRRPSDGERGGGHRVACLA
jgi:hypothetical protein